jgi:hypothetical protein
MVDKLELWVTSLSDTPHLQYYDVQTLEYRYRVTKKNRTHKNVNQIKHNTENYKKKPGVIPDAPEV